MVKKPKSFQKSSTAVTPHLLNPEQIAARRVPLEDAALNLSKKSNWHCHYCNRRFNSEGPYMKHHCEQKRRAEELTSPIGQAAFGYYREWMRLKKYSQPNGAAYMESKYYRSFINFAQLVIDANIARPEKFMEIMISGEILPILWCRDSAYGLYLDWNDKLSDPIDQVQASINYLMDICDKENVQLDNIFEHLDPQRVISLVRQRRLTPWLLFCSAKFGILLKTLDKSQLTAFNQVVNASYWGSRFQTETATVKNVKEIAKELGL